MSVVNNKFVNFFLGKLNFFYLAFCLFFLFFFLSQEEFDFLIIAWCCFAFIVIFISFSSHIFFYFHQKVLNLNNFTFFSFILLCYFVLFMLLFSFFVFFLIFFKPIIIRFGSAVFSYILFLFFVTLIYSFQVSHNNLLDKNLFFIIS